MKCMNLFVILMLSVFMFISSGGAVDVSQWELPEDVVARIGKGKITNMAYSPDGSLLAVGGYIGTWVYDTHTWEELFLFTGHTQPIAAVAFSPGWQNHSKRKLRPNDSIVERKDRGT